MTTSSISTKDAPSAKTVGEPPPPPFACSHCLACGYNNFPASEICPQCWSRNIQLTELSGNGVLYSFSSQVFAGEKHFVGYVDLPEQVRVFGRLTSSEQQRPSCGTRVTLTAIQPPGSGPCFAFAPSDERATE
ncbi:Zn-ribbon domain-containing OB-fold protein [Variovorax sp. LT1R20]|uniref:Zn-ribbon domain-containing OB-fold protein n=1 Tax=Variovorax sp. LT1R20 TaxID=3443729 RepID=UPI003F46E896